jgi:hypothetical protein
VLLALFRTVNVKRSNHSNHRQHDLDISRTSCSILRSGYRDLDGIARGHSLGQMRPSDDERAGPEANGEAKKWQRPVERVSRGAMLNVRYRARNVQAIKCHAKKTRLMVTGALSTIAANWSLNVPILLCREKNRVKKTVGLESQWKSHQGRSSAENVCEYLVSRGSVVDELELALVAAVAVLVPLESRTGV